MEYCGRPCFSEAPGGGQSPCGGNRHPEKGDCAHGTAALMKVVIGLCFKELNGSAVSVLACPRPVRRPAGRQDSSLGATFRSVVVAGVPLVMRCQHVARPAGAGC